MSKRTLPQVVRLAQHRRLDNTNIPDHIRPEPADRAIKYPDVSKPTTKQTPFQQPTQILSFSYTPSRVLEFNDSALRYYVNPPLGAQLGYGYDKWVRKPDGRGRIDSLLKAFSKARSTSGTSLQDVGVVSWRGVMTKILISPYEERDGWELNVMSINDTLYFEEHSSDERLNEINNMEPRHRVQMYYGYAFESYCTSETPIRTPPLNPSPSDPPGWGGDVETNVQWCSVVRTKLGNTRLLIGGEVDCVRGKYTRQTNTFIELKTSLTIRGAQDEARFEKKLLKFYFQSFLLGVPEIIVGFRTPSGVLTTTQTFKTIELPRLVRGKPGAWDPLICLAWGDQVISFLKDMVRRESSPDASVWRVRFTPRIGITVTLLGSLDVEDVQGGEDRVGFLPTWYWEELQTAGPRTEEAVTLGKPPTTATGSMLNAEWQI